MRDMINQKRKLVMQTMERRYSQAKRENKRPIMATRPAGNVRPIAQGNVAKLPTLNERRQNTPQQAKRRRYPGQPAGRRYM